MSTYTWSIAASNQINGTTYIKDTDNKIQAIMDDLVDFVNSEGDYTGQGLMFDYVNKASIQTITGVKTFSNGLIGNLTGNVTGNVTGNSATSNKLTTTRTIGGVSFDGSYNIDLPGVNIAGNQNTSGSSASCTGNSATATKLQTSRNISLTGAISGSVNFDGSDNVSINTTSNIVTFLSGMIMMWSGSIASIPSGWLLCNGLNGTPNLTDRFVIGAGGNYGVGTTGGSKDATLVSHSHSGTTTIENFNHFHSFTIGRSFAGDKPIGAGFGSGPYGITTSNGYQDQIDTSNDNTNHTHSFDTSVVGNSATNANLPPYYALCFIMKA